MKRYLLLLLSASLLVLFTPGHATIEWLENYDEAVQLSNRTEKPIVMVFLGSDWCGWCKRLEKEVFRSEAFAKATSDKLIFLKIDFPLRTRLPGWQQEQNEQLKDKYDIRGFPTLIILDEKQQQIATAGYQKGGGQKYADYLLKIIEEYRNYRANLSHVNDPNIDATALERMYQHAHELGQQDDIDQILKAGMTSNDRSFFLKEKYRLRVQKGLIHDPQTKKLRQQLLTSDPDNTKGCHYDVAVIDFEVLAENLEVNDGPPEPVVKPLLQYIDQFGSQDKDHLWRLQMTVSQTFLRKKKIAEALQYAKASLASAPKTMKPDIERAINNIEAGLL